MSIYSTIRYASSGGGGGGGGGVTTYSSYSAFPAASEASNGDLAFADDTGALYVFDGSEWDRIAAGSDETPVITTDPATSHALNSDGSTSTVTMVAEDPEGFDIEYGIAYKTSESRGLGSNGLPVQITGTSINQSTGVYTFTPSTTSGDTGSFTARLSASDGVKMTTRSVDFSLIFSTPITFSSSEPGISTNLSNSIVWSVTNINSGSGGAQSANLLTGKHYFEIDIASLSEPLIGICPESITDPGYTVSGQQSVYRLNGNWYPGNSSTGSIGGFGAGDILMFAYDTTTREVWAGQNGTWGLDPATDTGKSIGGTGAFTLWLGAGSSAGGSMTATILVGTANQNYSAPAGFSTH